MTRNPARGGIIGPDKLSQIFFGQGRIGTILPIGWQDMAKFDGEVKISVDLDPVEIAKLGQRIKKSLRRRQ